MFGIQGGTRLSGVVVLVVAACTEGSGREGFIADTTATRKDGLVDVCHRTGATPVVIPVEPAAVEVHVAHGDTWLLGPEVCDGNDNDCDGSVDEGAECDLSAMTVNDLAVALIRDGGSQAPFPSGTVVSYQGRNVVFSGGPAWGGVAGVPFVGMTQDPRFASNAMVPGVIVAPGLAEDPSGPAARVYRIRRDWRQADLSADAALTFRKDPAEVTAEDLALVALQYKADWVQWPASKGAPFYDADGDGEYEPRFAADGAPVLWPLADEPGLEGAAQVAWYALNDLDPAASFHDQFGTSPVGIELDNTLWAFDEEPLAGVVYARFTYKYLGTSPGSGGIEAFRAGAVFDPDLGDAQLNMIGCSEPDEAAYVYHAFGIDPILGLDAPPAWGLGMLDRPMNVCLAITNPGAGIGALADPATADEWVSVLQGQDPSGAPVVNPLTGETTTHMYTGTPNMYGTRVDGQPTGCQGDVGCIASQSPQAFFFDPTVTGPHEYLLTVHLDGGVLSWDLDRDGVGVRQEETGQDVFLADDVLEIFFPDVPDDALTELTVVSGAMWWSPNGGDSGGEALGGALTLTPGRFPSFLPSTVVDRDRDIELRFGAVDTGADPFAPVDCAAEGTRAYRYVRRATVGPDADGDGVADPTDDIPVTTGSGYVYQDRQCIAVTAWDTNPDPSQDGEPAVRLALGFLENNVPSGTVDRRYDPPDWRVIDNVSASSPREWLFLFDAPHDEADDPDLQQNLTVDAMPMLGIVYATRDAFPVGGEVYAVHHTFIDRTFADVFAEGDAFTFRTPTPAVGWFQGEPSDMRFVATTGPVDLAAGESFTVTTAMVAGQGVDQVDSVGVMLDTLRSLPPP